MADMISGRLFNMYTRGSYDGSNGGPTKKEKVILQLLDHTSIQSAPGEKPERRFSLTDIVVPPEEGPKFRQFLNGTVTVQGRWGKTGSGADFFYYDRPFDPGMVRAETPSAPTGNLSAVK